MNMTWTDTGIYTDEYANLTEIKRLLASSDSVDLIRARELAREILTKITHILITGLWNRQQCMEIIAASKKEWEAILQLDREHTLLNHFKRVWKDLWLDEDFVTQYIWLITAAGKDLQRKILWRETVFVREQIPREQLTRNLLALTASVAGSYDQYGDDFSSTRLTRQFERGRIQEFARWIDSKWLFLDLGCANGDMTEFIAKMGFKNSIWIDISPSMIDRANRKVAHTASYRVEDVFERVSLWDNSVDFILANFGSASEISRNIFPEISRLLTKWWIAYLSFYNNDALTNQWWQPWQTSIEWVKNPLCHIIEVPIIGSDGTVKTYKCYARGTDVREVKSRASWEWLVIESIESLWFLSSILPPLFFRDKKRESSSIEYEKWHASVEPFLGPYLNIVVRK